MGQNEETTQVEVELTLTLKCKRLKIDGAPYTVNEMSGKDRGLYLNSVGSRVIISQTSGKAVGMKDYQGLETALLKRCLRDANGDLVDEATMSAWPATTLGYLFDVARDLNGLTEESKKKMEDEAKND